VRAGSRPGQRCSVMTSLALRSGSCLCALLLLQSGPGQAGNEAQEWLDRMAYAVEFLNYEGTLVHTHGGHVSMLRVIHRVENGVVTERIISLDGSGREIIRDDQETTCILPDQEMVMVEQRDLEQREPGSPLRQRVLPYASFESAYYRLSLEGPGRAAGRRAQRVAVSPSDAYRYGYRLWLDHATAMPLKVQVADADGEVIEQLAFASIDLPRRIAADRVQARTLTESFTMRRSQRVDPVELKVSWHATELPPGFELMAARTKAATGNGSQNMEHLVYSDGLASVSVFIEKPAETDVPETGNWQVGAANAYSLRKDEKLITAVGEVPRATVEMIARSVAREPVAVSP